jgi:dTDP-4-amino-4,6-dideoxygalactose transaminase
MSLLFSNRESPLFSQPLHVGRPNIGSREEIHRHIDEILDRRWLSNEGPVVLELERRLADYVGVKHCLTVCNATIGLEIAYRATELSGEVIVPSNTFAATVHALIWQGIRPVFCDIDPITHNLDVGSVEACITDKTTGIVGVHLWGRPCPVHDLQKLADRYGLKLIFDAAHAFGCSLGGQMIGGFGDAEVFSFHATKFLNCGEGGAIATNDDDLAALIRQTRSFGFQGCDRIVRVGTNGKMNEFSAAVGLSSMDSIEEFIQVNASNYHGYREVLADIPGVEILTYDEQERNNFQYIVVDIDDRMSPLTRDQWLQVLHAENVLARRYFFPGMHRAEPYQSLDPFAVRRLPVTDAVLRRILVLPTGTAVGNREIELIGTIFQQATVRASILKRQLPPTLALPTAPIAPVSPGFRKAA